MISPLNFSSTLPALSIIAISSFMLFGAEIYLNLLAFWLMGAIIGGALIFEINRNIRPILEYRPPKNYLKIYV